MRPTELSELQGYAQDPETGTTYRIQVEVKDEEYGEWPWEGRPYIVSFERNGEMAGNALLLGLDGLYQYLRGVGCGIRLAHRQISEVFEWERLGDKAWGVMTQASIGKVWVDEETPEGCWHMTDREVASGEVVDGLVQRGLLEVRYDEPGRFAVAVLTEWGSEVHGDVTG